LAVAWRQRKAPISRFALAVTLGVWIFQECMKAKLPFYVLPTFPFLAYLTADAIVRCLHREYDDFSRRGFVIAAAIWALAVLALGGVPWLLEMPKLNLGGLLPTQGMVALSVAAVVYAGIVFSLLRSRRVAAGFIVMGCGSLLIFALIFTLFLPRARFLQTSERLAAIIRADGAKPSDAVKMIEYKEPSLAYYRDGSIVEERLERYFDETPASQWPKYAVLPKTVFDRITLAVAKELRQIGPTVRGLDYAGKIDGRRVIDVLVVKPKP
jgi:4-amino-4-deoxy-L-arabinose transferase-like glycosyltransferase